MDRRRSSRDPVAAADVRQGGYALLLSAVLMLPMFVAVGLAVDVGAWYLHASRMQAAADAGALAGVVHMPDFGLARATALEQAAANGFDDDDPEVTVEVTRDGDQKLRVTITDARAPLFFTSVTLDEVDITRSAVAEYLKPIPLGSPSNVFGNRDVDPATPDPEFWAAVNGSRTSYQQGDPYQVLCLDTPLHLGTAAGCSGTNLQYRPEGYWFAVDVPASQVGNLIDVWVFDPRFVERGSFLIETGDHVYYEEDAAGNILATQGPAPSTRFTVHDQDSTPLDYTDNPVHAGCGTPSNPLTLDADTVPEFRNSWILLCSFTPTFEGIYPLQVQTSSADGALPLVGDGTNGFALGASIAGCGTLVNPLATCEPPRVYALGEMSIFVNGYGGTTEFYLGEIGENREGETFLFRAFDPGDGGRPGDTFRMTLEPPPGYTIPSCTFQGIDESDPERPVVVSSGTSSGGCTITTRDAGAGSLYNGLWLEAEVQVPVPYACDPAAGDDCWWTVRYDVPNVPTDRVTFEVLSSRDPVRLVG